MKSPSSHIHRLPQIITMRLRLSISLLTLMTLMCLSNGSQHMSYIVHMDKSSIPSSFDDHVHWYGTIVKSVSQTADLLYTYNTIIDGFLVRLTTEEAELLKEQPGVLLVREDAISEVHTTRSPDFLGLPNVDASLPEFSTPTDVIIGVLDSGVWPEISSFSDEGLGPIPSGWKGLCEVGPDFSSSSCNRKLIGARFFSQGFEASYGPIDEKLRSPRDHVGHGTHTSTTAAGSAVIGANLFGFATGTARGMAKHARVASYKVCWLETACTDSDILAGMEKAIEDGVHIISVSLAGTTTDYFKDAIALGALEATSRGIYVSCSAGNQGPKPRSLSNVAPWVTTIGASTIDRQFPAYVSLGNEKVLIGTSLYAGEQLTPYLVPLVYAGNVSRTYTGNLCLRGSLNPKKVNGKIVVCDIGMTLGSEKSLVVKDAGGVGMILANTFGEDLLAEAHFIPTAVVGQIVGEKIKAYIFSEPNPIATLSSGGTQGVQPAPVIAGFSSRGPNHITSDILKPDLIAPGVNILAGWTGKIGPTRLTEDSRNVSFNIISGTSMSCPHVSGIAALIKSAHPQWSPAAIKSALMTTAYSRYKNGERIRDLATGMPSTPFHYGAGHVDPISALEPGLIYDATIDNYVDFLCALNYSSSMIKVITKRDYSCKKGKEYRVGDLNYPSFAVPLQTASGPTVVKYTRTLTNVGNPSTYKVEVFQETNAVKILVIPEVLEFNSPNEHKAYTVTFTASSMPLGTTNFAHLEWTDGQQVVGSPIAFSWV